MKLFASVVGLACLLLMTCVRAIARLVTIGAGATRAATEIAQAAASRSAEAAPRRSRHRTRPWIIRASGTAKVGTMTSG